MDCCRREPIVFVVDDDDSVRGFLETLIGSVGLRCEVFPLAQDFIDAYEPGTPGCLVLDIRMPGKSGLELQSDLSERGVDLPVIILTGHASVPVAVHALKAGAFDFIEKPFNNELLIDSVQKAVAESLSIVEARFSRERAAERLALLTPREKQILKCVVGGDTNKIIAYRLGISEKTVESHRSSMMSKMNARSVIDLVGMTDLLHLR